MKPQIYTPDEAVQFAKQGRIQDWVHAFLNGPGNNEALSLGLAKEPRFWRGPIVVPLSRLERCCGPEASMEFPESPEVWQPRIEKIATAVKNGSVMPPLLAQYRKESLSLRDGNHRQAGLLAAGIKEYWTIIWFDCAEDSSVIF